MDCRDFRKMVSMEIDGEIDPVDRDALERHLGECEGCRIFKKSMLEAFSIHRAMKEARVPPSILPAVMAAVERPAGRGWMRSWLRVAVPAAAALIMFLGIKIGGMLNEIIMPDGNGEQVEAFDTDYLDEYPPGSMGEVLMAAMEEVEDE